MDDPPSPPPPAAAPPGTAPGGGPHGPLMAVDHVGVAVRDLEAAVAWYGQVLGAGVAHRQRMEADGVDEVLMAAGPSFVQLLRPFRADSPVARFLERRGEGLHHVAYRVPDCALALGRAVAAGARPVDLRPRPGSRGTTVAFLHPEGAHGTLVELVEEPGAGPEPGPGRRGG